MRWALVMVVAACGRVGFDAVGDDGDASSGCGVVVVPPATAINTTSQATFSASGGSPPYTYEVIAGGGQIDAASGIFTSPDTTESATIRVTDQDGCAAAVTVTIGGDVLWFLGGSIISVATDEVLRSDDGGATWQLAGRLPAARIAGGVFVLDDRMWFTGGEGAGFGFPEIWSSTDGATWRTEQPWTGALIEHSVVAYAGRIWMMGGSTDVRATFDGTTWTRMGDLPSYRHETTALNHNGTMFFLGGHDGGATFYSEVVSSTDGATWTTVSAFSGGRENAGMAAHAGKLWVAGGYDGVSYRDDVQISSDGASWTTIAPLPTARNYGDLLSFRGQLLFVGGSTDVWATTDGSSWTTIGALPAANVRGRVLAYSPR